MGNTIRIVHLSDIHAREDKKRELMLRLNALIRDIEKVGESPDMILVTGDIAYSGKPVEYILASELFDSLCKRLCLNKARLLFCPGNHDIDRSLVDQMTEQGIRRALLDSQAAESVIDSPKYSLPQQKAYIDFVNSMAGSVDPLPSRAMIVDLAGVKLGVAAMNSAWRCTDDLSKETLFLTLPQVHRMAENVADAQLRIALVHHPMDWFHPTEQSIVQNDMLRRFDLILTGHLHIPATAATRTPTNESLVYTVPSFFDGDMKNLIDGYNYYNIDLAERKIIAAHRKFIRIREEYDRYVDHAPNGESYYDLPHSAIARLPGKQLSTRITQAANALELSINSALQVAQHIDKPILVQPRAEVMTLVAGRKHFQKVEKPYEAVAGTSTVVYGPPDVGTTTFIKGACSFIINNNHARCAIYVDHSDFAGAKKPEHICQVIRKRIKSES